MTGDRLSVRLAGGLSVMIALLVVVGLASWALKPDPGRRCVDEGLVYSHGSFDGSFPAGCYDPDARMIVSR